MPDSADRRKVFKVAVVSALPLKSQCRSLRDMKWQVKAALKGENATRREMLRAMIAAMSLAVRGRYQPAFRNR